MEMVDEMYVYTENDVLEEALAVQNRLTKGRELGTHKVDVELNCHRKES